MKRTLGPRCHDLVLALFALLLISLAVASLPIASAGAASYASFPGPPPPVQITRNLSLQQAARAGVLKLTAKGGFEGDDVELELEGKRVSAPITVTLHLEFAWAVGHSESEQKVLRDDLPRLEREAEKELNKRHYKTRKGEPINFDFDYKFRAPGEAPDPNYDQVTIINPRKDLPEPNPDYRANLEDIGSPNTDKVVNGTFPLGDLQPQILAHESLHYIGLDDRYTDVYSYKGREIALPERGMSPKDLAAFLKSQKPPVPPPPAGDVEPKNSAGTKRCDIMGSGADLPCRKISNRDLKWIESQAGLQVEAKPGEVLLNKHAADQNLAIGFLTKVIARPGETTIAPGVSGYCIDHSKMIPGLSAGGFDVGPAVSTLPGFSGVERLLKLNAELQPSLGEPLEGMQLALWNVTDGSRLEDSFSGPEVQAAARALLARAGVPENSTPGGLQHFGDPNGAAAATGAVDASGTIMPPLASEPAPPPPAIRADTAELVPAKVSVAPQVRSSLVLGLGGEVSAIALTLQHRSGHKWRSVKSLPGRKIQSGEAVIPLKLGSLKTGKYRVQVKISGPTGKPVVKTAPLTVGG